MEDVKIKGNTIFLTVVGVAALLFAVAATTFSYFTAAVTKTQTENTISVQTASLTMNYDNGNAVTVTNLLPAGGITSKVVTIKNNHSTIGARYTLRWTGVSNTFVNKSDFTYAVNCTGGTTPPTKASAPMPSANDNILTNISIAGGVTHTCTISFSYPNTASDQSSDMAKAFSGNLDVVPNQI